MVLKFMMVEWPCVESMKSLVMGSMKVKSHEVFCGVGGSSSATARRG